MKKNATICCPPAQKHEGVGLKVKDADRELAALAKALGHPARVKIVRHLLKARSCICGDIVSEVGLAQATVSQHLKVLKAAGLISGNISGTAVCYCLNTAAFKRFRSVLGELS